MEQLTGSKLGKEDYIAIYCPPIWLTCRVHHVKCWSGWITSCNQDSWEKYQQQICRLYPSNGRKWRVTKEPLNEGERGEWKSWVETQHATKIMACSPITWWQTEREKVEAVMGFILGGSKISVDGSCCHEIKRLLFLGRKAMRNLDNILKS